MDKAILIKIGEALVILLVGWILITIILRLSRRALGKSRLDGALHTFILNSIKAVALDFRDYQRSGEAGGSDYLYGSVLSAGARP